jgi:hypothetical protein
MNTLNPSMTDESHREENPMNNTDNKKGPWKAELIFVNKPFLEYIITRLQKFLKRKLQKNDGKYICYGDANQEGRWLKTEHFCRMMGIDLHFIWILAESLNYPDCEGEFVNNFSVEEALEKIQQYEEEEQEDN